MATNVWGDKETEFFFELTPDRILNSFEKVTGLRASGRTLALNSMENRVYEIELEPDDDTPVRRSNYDMFKIVKFYRPGRWSQPQIQEEHNFLWELVEGEVPVVAPWRNQEGQSLFKDETTGLFFTIFPKVGGRSPHELSKEQLEIVGRLMARMHNVGASKKADHRLHLTPETYGKGNLDFILAGNFLPTDLRSEFHDTAMTIVETITPWFQETPSIRVHGDCHFGNLLWSTEGAQWVDFDDFVTAPAVQDLWLMIPGRDPLHQRQLDTMIRGYEMLREFDWDSLRLIEPLRALRFIHFHAWISRRWQDPAFPRAFPDYNSHGYWQTGLQDLKDQLAFIKKA